MNKEISEPRYDRHEKMIHCTFVIALTSGLVALLALWRTL